MGRKGGLRWEEVFVQLAGFVTGLRFRVAGELESCGSQAWELPYAAPRNRKLGKTCLTLIFRRTKTDLFSFFCLCAKVPEFSSCHFTIKFQDLSLSI